MVASLGNGSIQSASSSAELRWPEAGVRVIPDWVYTSEDIYRREIERIFHGPSWNFVGLSVEIPNKGDYRRAYVGETPIVVVRGDGGKIHVFENRCAHRGTEFCQQRRGHVEEFVCPYHQWQYDLQGNLRSIPFRRGLNGKGGMPADFKLEEHGLRKLFVAERNGLIFASYSDTVEPLEEYLGAEVVEEIDNVFEGREVKILGYVRQRWPCNWKLYHENIRDPNHASLLHVFLRVFGLFRPDQVAVQYVSKCGRHSIGCVKRGSEQTGANQAMNTLKSNASVQLKDDRLVQYTKEDRGPWSASIQSIWPNFAVQRQANTLAVREIIPHGPTEFYMHWTLFGYADDSPEMTAHRLRQANLVGPAGLVGADDSEVLEFVRSALHKTVPGVSVVRLGGDELGTADHLLSEAAIRSLYTYYREAMGL